MSLARPSLTRFLQLAAAAALLAASAVHADDYGDIAALLKDGKASQALVQVEQRLAATPKDPQLRFLRGVAQSESKQTQAAIETFTQLTRDYPELPEPYNNLAVLYAQENQLDKARTALEMAIRTNPSYATAHENLGDIYAKLAAQAYNKALQLDAGHGEAVKPKLALIHELFSAHTAAPASPAAAAPAPAQPQAPTPASTAKAPIPAATPEAAQAAAPEPAVADAPGEQAVAAAVHAWAQAWAAKDMTAYFSAYASDFALPAKQSRAGWEKDRRARITGKTRISITLSDMRIEVDGDKATASFRQDYRGDALHVNSSKKLTLVRQGAGWKIVRESVG